MKRWFNFSALTLTLVVILAACSSESTPTGTMAVELPSTFELKQAGQELFNTFSASMQSQDGNALHEILVADLRQRCTAQQLYESLVSGGEPFPNFEVSSIYLDLEDHSNALMQLTLLDQPGDNPAGLSAGFILAFPFPIELEEDGWRLGFPSMVLISKEGCPFVGESSEGEASVSAQRSAAVDPQPGSQLLEMPQLTPPSGVLTVMSSSGGGEGQFTSSALLQTDLPLATLLEHYRQQVVQPNWEVGQDTKEEDLAAFTWTSRDDAGRPSFGALLITSSEVGLWWVRLWTGTSIDISSRLLAPESRESLVPASTGSN